MLKKTILTLPLLAIINSAVAQTPSRYTFKDTTMAYADLPANATSVNGTTVWEDENYLVPVPFYLQLDSAIQLNSLTLCMSEQIPGFLNREILDLIVTGFTPTSTDLVDRGKIDGAASRSPLRHLTTGTAPNRIFKAEMRNVGFEEEWYLQRTLDDSANIQCWIYEGSNIVELHYGPSRVTHFSDYFVGDASSPGTMYTGFVQQLSMKYFTGNFYYLSGAPVAPALKTKVFPDWPADGLTAWPANGTVYRFTPRTNPAGIPDLKALGQVKVYPNPAGNTLHVEGTSAGTKATLYSMLGQPVLQTVLAGQQTIDIAALPAGVYKLVLTDKEGVNIITTVIKE